MQLVRPPIGADPLQFGKAGKPALPLAPVTATYSSLSDDLKLFATTFFAGFLVVSVFLA